MYRVMFYEDALETPDQGTVIHEPANYGAKISEGSQLDLSLEGLGISTFEFSVNIENPLYHKAKPVVNMIAVTDINQKEIFRGRIANITNAMSASGEFREKVLCEDEKSYLYDSTQKYMKPTVMTISEYLGVLIAEHNAQVEPHKRFVVGQVTVSDDDGVYRGIAYGKTAEVIKDKLLDRLGGYLILRKDEATGANYLDYLKDYGEHSDTPLQVTRNLKSAERNINVDELMTVCVPLGQDIEESEEVEIGTDYSRPRVTIADVNDGKDYIESPELIEQFGRITGEASFPNVVDKNILKSRGQDALTNQRVMLITWSVEAIELGLIDGRYELITLGNYYPLENPHLYGNESLQVIEKRIDILNPQRITLTIGTGKKTLSQYQMEYAGLQYTIASVQQGLNSNANATAGANEGISAVRSTVNAQAITITLQQQTLQDQQALLQQQQAQLTELQNKVDELSKT